MLSFTNPCANPIAISFDPCLDTNLLKNSGFQNFAKVNVKTCSSSTSTISYLLRLVFLMENIK